VPDGRDALEQLRQTKVDLLISDIVMPERDGLEILRLAPKDFAGLKVIVMSGAFDGRFLRTCRDAGGSRYVAKAAENESGAGDGARGSRIRVSFERWLRTVQPF
jgi:two-component system response regulator YesN